MSRFIEAINPFVDELLPTTLGFEDVSVAGWANILLKFYLCGYANQIQSRQRPECEAGSNVEGV